MSDSASDRRAPITIVGLGPGSVGDITDAARQHMAEADRLFLRTGRHPTADLAGDAATFDHLYDRADDLGAVYRGIADTLADAATAAAESGESVVYAVPGSPLVLERSVRHLRADPRVEVELIPAISFLDTTWARLGVDPVEESVRLVDGHTFAVDAAGERGPLLVAHAHADWVLSDIKLAIDAGPEQRVIVLQRLGTDDESITDVAWPDLDRVVEPDHLTSLYLPEVHAPVARELQRTVELMHRLRQECPWDQEQTLASLRPFLIEESYEVLEALDAVVADPDDLGAYAELEEELGDVWFQILFQTELASEAGAFTIADVARTVHDKLVGRHPHVFGDAVAQSAADVVATWEQAKQTEKQRSSIMDGIPSALPALGLAAKVLTRARRAGAVIDETWVAEQLADAANTDAVGAHAVGRWLLAMVEVAHRSGIDAEAALRDATGAAERRFRSAEAGGIDDDRWIRG